jgi:hypothetical protein
MKTFLFCFVLDRKSLRKGSETIADYQSSDLPQPLEDIFVR